jgi:hypothetical protein
MVEDVQKSGFIHAGKIQKSKEARLLPVYFFDLPASTRAGALGCPP